MRALQEILTPIQAWNDVALAAARWIGIIVLAFMVAVTLVQVFARYILNDALAWPDEAARFAMLWLTGLMAPTAYRRGGFVSINMVGVALLLVVNVELILRSLIALLGGAESLRPIPLGEQEIMAE